MAAYDAWGGSWGTSWALSWTGEHGPTPPPVQRGEVPAGRAKHKHGKRRDTEGFAAEIDGELRYFESLDALRDFLAYLEEKSTESREQVVEGTAIQVIEHGKPIPKKAPDRFKFNSGPTAARNVVDEFNAKWDKLFRERLAVELKARDDDFEDEIAFEMLLSKL